MKVRIPAMTVEIDEYAWGVDNGIPLAEVRTDVQEWAHSLVWGWLDEKGVLRGETVSNS